MMDIHIGDRVEVRVEYGTRIGRVVDVFDDVEMLVDLGGPEPLQFSFAAVVSVDPARGER